MRGFGVPLIFLLVGLVVFGGWYLTRDRAKVGGEPIRNMKTEGAGGTEAQPVLGPGGGTLRSGLNWDEIAEGWAVPLDEMPQFGGVSETVAKLGGLCFGRSVAATNNLETKRLVRQLVADFAEMSEEEKRRLAEYFRNSDDPALKFWLTRAFTLGGGEPFVEVVAENYHADKNTVGEALQYMAVRTPRAIEALEALIQQALDPVERENLIVRMGFVGAAAAKDPLRRAFANGGSDRRVALNGLAGMRDEESMSLVWGVIDGDQEAVAYAPTTRRPASSSFDDLRAHAVNSFFLRGGEEPARALVDRLARDDGDPVVRGYIEEFVAVHPTEKLVEPVVNLMLEQGRYAPGLLRYLAARAKPEQADIVARLNELDLEEAQRQELTQIIGRLR